MTYHLVEIVAASDGAIERHSRKQFKTWIEAHGLWVYLGENWVYADEERFKIDYYTPELGWVQDVHGDQSADIKVDDHSWEDTVFQLDFLSSEIHRASGNSNKDYQDPMLPGLRTQAQKLHVIRCKINQILQSRQRRNRSTPIGEQ